MGGSNSKRKRQPSAPRLDATGFLMHEPDDLPCPSVAWVDQPTGTGVVTSYDNDPGGSPVTVTFYNALKYGEYTISVGDDIALTPEKKGEGTELCTVKAFYAVDDPDEPMRKGWTGCRRPAPTGGCGAACTSKRSRSALPGTRQA